MIMSSESTHNTHGFAVERIDCNAAVKLALLIKHFQLSIRRVLFVVVLFLIAF